MRKLLLATKNLGKVAEFERLLKEFTPDIKVLGLADFPNMPEVIESGKSLNENAMLKAKTICQFSSLPCLSDDSGLFIDALNGDPGIYSARWAGYEGDDTKVKDLANINKVLSQLKDVPAQHRGAQFKSVVAFCQQNLDGSFVEKQENGALVGQILTQAIGSAGFGYDPIFLPDNFSESLAQLSPGVKDEISHRGAALRAIAPFLRDHLQMN